MPLRTHSGIRPYKCTICGKAFTTSRDLTRHRNKIHAELRDCLGPYKTWGSGHVVMLVSQSINFLLHMTSLFD